MGDEPRRIRKPTVLGVQVPDDDDVPRNVRRSHPGAESTTPPPAERPTRLAFERSETPYNLRIFDTSKLPGARLPPVEQAPASSADVVHLKIPTKLVVAMVGAIVTAAIGGFGASKATEKPSASPESMGVLAAEVKAIREDVREIRDHVREMRGAQAERWDLTSAVLCKLNGKPWARGLDCDALDVEFEALPADAVYVAPKFKAKAQWPFLPRPP